MTEPPSPLRGMARLRAAFGHSLRGFRDVWSGEEAFRIEVIALAIAIPVAGVISASAADAALLIATVLLLLIVEVVNTAIEALVDRIGPERHELSRQAKDLGSLAVLLATILVLVVWGAALYGWAMGPTR